jgi:hypothetical protein
MVQDFTDFLSGTLQRSQEFHQPLVLRLGSRPGLVARIGHIDSTHRPTFGTWTTQSGLFPFVPFTSKCKPEFVAFAVRPQPGNAGKQYTRIGVGFHLRKGGISVLYDGAPDRQTIAESRMVESCWKSSSATIADLDSKVYKSILNR